MYKAQDPFGGRHTIEKLEKLEAYLKGYLNVFKNKDWVHTIYFDAFAGTGTVPTDTTYPSLPLGDEDRHFIIGSARRALELPNKFNEYIFVEKSRKKANELKSTVRERYSDVAERVTVLNKDANVALQSFWQDN